MEGTAPDIFALQNRIAGYQYDPEGLSPIPVWKHHFSMPVGRTETVCGPDLRYVAGKKTYTDIDSTFVTETYGNGLDEHRLEIRNLADGAHLLKSGPTLGTRAPLGNGMCGGCPAADFTIYHLSPTTGITLAFLEKLNLDMPESEDGDIRVSPNWQTVTVYRAAWVFSEDHQRRTDVWSSKRYCLAGARYQECGDGASAPPSPRQIQWSNER